MTLCRIGRVPSPGLILIGWITLDADWLGLRSQPSLNYINMASESPRFPGNMGAGVLEGCEVETKSVTAKRASLERPFRRCLSGSRPLSPTPSSLDFLILGRQLGAVAS